jgi:hypothetical protein
MSVRHLFIALAVVLCAGAILLAVDYQSLMPQPPHLFAAR